MRRSSRAILLILGVHVSSAQAPFDFGVGIVIPPGGDYIHAVILSRPDPTADTVATLSNGEFDVFPNHQKVRAFLSGFDKYDYRGLPILSINKDSSWAKVSLQAADIELIREGWVSLKIPQTTIRIWATFLLTQQMILKPGTPLRFYSKPSSDALLKIKLPGFWVFPERNYILHPLRRKGRWLLVELEVPVEPCGGTEEIIEQKYGVKVKRMKVWIQYLDKRMRPLVAPPMMC